jgi:hypothetical protein
MFVAVCALSMACPACVGPEGEPVDGSTASAPSPEGREPSLPPGTLDASDSAVHPSVIDLRWLGGVQVTEFDSEREMWRFGLTGLVVEYCGRAFQEPVSVFVEVDVEEWSRARVMGGFESMIVRIATRAGLQSSGKDGIAGPLRLHPHWEAWFDGGLRAVALLNLGSTRAMVMADVVGGLEMNRLECEADHVHFRLDSAASTKLKWVILDMEDHWRSPWSRLESRGWQR